MYEPGMGCNLFLVTLVSVVPGMFTIPQRNVTKLLHETVEFPCYSAPERSDVTRVWFHNDIMIHQGWDSEMGTRVKQDGVLVIPEVEDKNAGKYTCRINNSFGHLVDEVLVFLVVEYPARVENAPKYQSLQLGESGIIECSVRSHPPLEFTIWSKNGRLVEWDESRGIRTFPNGSLFISLVTNDTRGTYRCMPYNRHGTRGISGKMQVSVFPSPKGSVTISVPPRDTITIEGDQVVLNCRVDSPDHVTHRWFRNEANIDLVPWLKIRTIVQQDGALVINNTSAEDSGHYQCQVDNGVGQPKIASAYLDVQYPARVIYSPNLQYLAVGIPGTIFCEVKANPPALFVTWTFNKVQFDSTMVPGLVAPHNGSLHFKTFNKENEGVYSCTPYNSFGTAGSSNNMNVIAVKGVIIVKTKGKSSGLVTTESKTIMLGYLIVFKIGIAAISTKM